MPKPLGHLLIAVLFLRALTFSNCAWCDNNNPAVKSDGLTDEQFAQQQAVGRKKFEVALFGSVKSFSQEMQNSLMPPDQIQALLSEIEMQSAYFFKDSDRYKDEGVKASLEKAKKGLPNVLQALKNSPYNLRETFYLIQSVNAMEGAAEILGDSYLENRFSVIKEKLVPHFDVLCQMDDIYLDHFFATTNFQKN